MYLGNMAFLAVKICMLLLPHADNPVNTKTNNNTGQGWWAIIAVAFSIKDMKEDFFSMEYPPVLEKRETRRNGIH